MADAEVIARMTATLRHRGPDAVGQYVAGPVGLGQSRLSIIDLRDTANPPLSNEDGSVWVVSNGEIYNFRELRDSLESRGHRFRTNCDTEVLPHLYEDFGDEAVRHLDGMFAFAIWDSREQRLFAARDPLGKKPFVYARTSRALVFGSEIKCLFAAEEVSRAPNPEAIASYLRRQYVRSPLSAFDGVFKLEPGSTLLCDRSGKLTTARYWAPPEARPIPRDREEAEGEFAELLGAAVRKRLVSDVPLGAWLSGGIDSSLVVATMAEVSPTTVKTFTVGFEGASGDERPFAAMVAKRYGTTHQEILLRPTAVDILPKLVWHYNEPFADSSAIPTFLLAEQTRKQVTVVLSGDGGDESFAGYGNYGFVLDWERRFPGQSHLRRALCGRAAGFVERLGRGDRRFARAGIALRMAGAAAEERFAIKSSLFKPSELPSLLTPPFASGVVLKGGGELPPRRDGEDLLAWMMRADQSRYLPDCLLVKTDIASMASALEVRCPLLDPRIVQFAAGLPSNWKWFEGKGKRFLREYARRVVPDAIVAKPKTGFRVPLQSWFRGGMDDTIRDLVVSDRTTKRGVVRPEAGRRLLAESAAGRVGASDRVWALAMLELWFRVFIDSEGA